MTSPPAIELTIMPLFPRTKSKTNKQSQPPSQSPQDRTFLGRESTSSITSDNELLAMSYAKAGNDPSPPAFAVGGGIVARGTNDAAGGNTGHGDDATTNSDEQVKNLPKTAFSTFLSPAERKRRAQQKAKEAEAAKDGKGREGCEDEGAGGGGGETGMEGSNNGAMRPPSQSQPPTSLYSSSSAAVESAASPERDDPTGDKENDNATTSSEEQVKHLPKAAFSTFLSPAERKRRALEKQQELQKKLQQKEEGWGNENRSQSAPNADNEEEEEKREIEAREEEQFDMVPEVSAAIPRRPSPPPAAKLTTSSTSNISSISSSNHNSNLDNQNPESELPTTTTSSSPSLVATSNHQAEIPEESDREKAKRRAIQNVMRDSSLSFAERNEKIQKIMKGDFPMENDDQESPTNAVDKTLGITSSVKSASSSAQPAAMASSGKPATATAIQTTHRSSEIPDESDEDLQKRKAIQQVMRDSSLSAIQRHEKIQKIIQGDLGDLTYASASNSSSSSDTDFDSNELEEDDDDHGNDEEHDVEEEEEYDNEEESEVAREPLEPGTHNEPVAPLAVSKSVTRQLEPMAPLIKTKSVAFGPSATATAKMQEEKKRVAFADEAVGSMESSGDEKNGDGGLDWATAAAIGAATSTASTSSGAAGFWQRRDEAERKRKEEEEKRAAAVALSKQQEMERKRSEEAEAAAFLRQKEQEHKREIELLEQKRERELLELKIRMEEESELKKLQQQRELELQRHQEELELQRQRAIEEEAEWKKQQEKREMELQQQIQMMELQQQRQREELELKMQRQQAELELQRQMEMEMQRQRELELAQQQRELEFQQEMERQRQAEAAELAKEEKRLVEERRRHLERQQLERQQQQQQQDEQQRLREERERELQLPRQPDQEEQVHAARAIGSSSTASSPAVAPNHSNFTSLRPSALLHSRARGPHYARSLNYDPNPSSHDGVPDEELNWRLDSYVSLSDFTIVVQRALPGPLAPDFDSGTTQGIDFILDSDGSPRTDVYHVHKVMLAVGSRRSEYLGRLIREADGTSVGWGSSSPDNHSSDITVHETILLESAANSMGAVLDFCYYQDRELDINLENAVALVYLAKRYKIRALQTRADAFVKNNLESSNSIHFLLDSYLYQLDDILNQAIDVTAANLADTVDFEPIYALPPELFRRIILSWKLQCDSELLSLVVYSYCGEHNRDKIDVDYFREITTPNLMPILDSKVAMMVLKFYVDLIFEDDPDVDIMELCKDDSLIKRCIDVISQNWRDEVCEPLMIDTEWEEASPATRRNLPPHEPAALHRQLPSGLQNMLLEKCILEAKSDVDTEKTVVEEYDGEKEIELKKNSAIYDEMVTALQTELAMAKSQRDEENASHKKQVEDLEMKALELEAELDNQKRIMEEYKQELRRFRRVPGIHNFGEVSQSDRSIIDKTKCTYSANPEHHYPLHRRGKRPPTQMPRLGSEFENLGRENGYIYDDGNGERLPVFYYQERQSARF
ncbi:hypothetical protein ACHAXS_004686 [Conticribra weissflogii]